MALLVVVFEPQGLQANHRQLHASLRGKLFSMVEGLKEETVSSNECLATKMWLPHSRTTGFANDAATGSWLTCTGNPTGRSIAGLPAEKVAQRLLTGYLREGRKALTDLNAPFVVIVFDGRKRALHVVTDRGGLQRIYLRRVGGAFILCSSSLALASCLPIQLDPKGVATYFQTGGLLGEVTLCTEIRKVGAAKWLTLSEDGADEEQYWQPPTSASGGDIEEWAGELLEAGVEAAEMALNCGLPTTVELTGGLDSRFNLACALKTGRPFSGFTIGDVVQEDVDIAARLACQGAFEHLVASPLEELRKTFETDFEEIHRLSDGEGDCVNVIASPAANRQAAPLRSQSITGITGELFRGHYYRSLGLFSGDVNLRRLVDWQLCLNSGYRSELFSPRFSDGDSVLFDGVVGGILAKSQGHNGAWRAEHFQLFGPIQGTAGRSMTFNGFFYRQAVSQCSNRMLDLAFRMPPSVKRRSMVVRKAIEMSDPTLAEIPLCGGRPVRGLTARNALPYARSWLRYGRKIQKKVMAKCIGKFVPKKIAGGLRGVLRERLVQMCRKHLDVRTMASAGIYDRERLEGFIEKNLQAGLPDATQVGLILSMEMTFRHVGANLALQ